MCCDQVLCARVRARRVPHRMKEKDVAVMNLATSTRGCSRVSKLSAVNRTLSCTG